MKDGLAQCVSGVSRRLSPPDTSVQNRCPGPALRLVENRCFLFLQGPPSPFARELGAQLAAMGASVRRINFSIGDWFWWHDARAASYRGHLSDWERYLEDLVRREGVSDIVYFADRVPYHRAAQRVADRLGIRAISFEYGYLRPDWITVEPGGQSAWSRFPADIARVRELAADLPAPGLARQYHTGTFAESAGDAGYYLANYLLWFLYPRFQRDRIYPPLAEYLSYPLRFLRARLGRAKAHRLIEELTAGSTRYFVVPLQMQNDYQIRANSPWTDQRDFLDRVISSFAGHAPDGTKLVVKVHPMDNGLENWRGYIGGAARRHGVAGRVQYLDGGDLHLLTGHAAGMVIVNSTCGIAALQAGCPLKVLGIATFDMAGLTHQGALDDFWTDPGGVDPGNAAALMSLMAHRAHVRGDFYAPEGRHAAVRAMADRLMAAEWERTFEANPPRLEKGRRLGISLDG